MLECLALVADVDNQVHRLWENLAAALPQNTPEAAIDVGVMSAVVARGILIERKTAARGQLRPERRARSPLQPVPYDP